MVMGSLGEYQNLRDYGDFFAIVSKGLSMYTVF